MKDYEAYSKILTKSVNHIFKKFLDDNNIAEVYESQAKKSDPLVAIEIKGTLYGELIINMPQKTLDKISKKFIGNPNARISKNTRVDIAGELANLITGTFANLMQYAEHDLILSPPEFNDDPISLKTLYDNVNISFLSSYGGFDVDFYYREEN
ncbi:MAG: chemotaxis protein CheX [Leptospirales bacterium]|jgi:CheY-specific phosphatase CheX|nr:chemotaxis protein CheX [Leptospirales bacterium]